MKKILLSILALVMLAAFFTGCDNKQGDQDQEQPDTSTPVISIRAAGLKGPTSMGLVSLMDAAENGDAANDYTFSIHGTADEVTTMLVKGELDFAAIPANLASVLYKNTEGQIQILSINTLGVVYLVENGDSVASLEDLKGKTIYATGKGTVPEYALRYILSQNDIDFDNDISMEWKTEPTEVVAIMKENENVVAMLPQPFTTVAQGAVEGLRIVSDLNAEWQSLDNGSEFVTGVLVGRKAFIDENAEAVSAFLDEYKTSVEFINNNIDQGAALVAKYNIVAEDVAKKAIPYCNITFIEGAEMKSALLGYYDILYSLNPASIGGEMPDEGFYFARQ